MKREVWRRGEYERLPKPTTYSFPNHVVSKLSERAMRGILRRRDDDLDLLLSPTIVELKFVE